MDYYAELYADLHSKMEAELPITAYPVRQLVQILRKDNSLITLKSKLTISAVINSGDVSGILCEIDKGKDGVVICGLMHLIFDRNFKLYKEILEYQKKRFKRIQQLNKL